MSEIFNLRGNVVVADGFRDANGPVGSGTFDGDASDVDLAAPVLTETDVQAALEALADAVGDLAPVAAAVAAPAAYSVDPEDLAAVLVAAGLMEEDEV